MIKTTIDDNRFALIKPVVCDPDTQMTITSDLQVFKDWCKAIASKAPIVAFDTETRGTDMHHSDFKCVGIGLSVGEHSIYLDVKEATEDTITDAFKVIRPLPLIAHNLFFDARVAAKYLGTVRGTKVTKGPGWCQYQFCTYNLLYELANEGFKGQKYSLKWAEKHILGWEETNEIERDKWLIEQGFITDRKKLDKLDTPEKRLERWNERDKNGRRKLKPDLAEMWRVDKDILGHYCCLDALATWQLFTYVLEPAMKSVAYNVFKEWHQTDVLTWIRAHVDAYFHGGIKIQVAKLEAFSLSLERSIAKREEELRTHPEIKGFIKEWETSKLQEHLDKEPSKYKVMKDKKEPTKYKKNGGSVRFGSGTIIARNTHALQ